MLDFRVSGLGGGVPFKLSGTCADLNFVNLQRNKSELIHLLGGSWDLVSKVISTLIGVISSYKYSYHNYNPSY